MNIIDSALEKHGLTRDELPKKISNKIHYLEETEEQLEATKADFEIEDDAEVKAEMQQTIDQAVDYIAKLSEHISGEIEAFVAERKAAAEGKQGNGAPTPAPKPPVETQGNEAPKKKGGALPWIIGGVLLVLTLGAVNVMQEK